MNYERKPIAIPEWSMYECDTEGNVYNKKGSKPLKYSINCGGYCIVNLYDHNTQKGFAVHTLIATTFIPNSEDKTQVNHIDGDKTNNKVENLEWVTPLENVRHAIEVLGRDKIGVNNPRHREIFGYDKITKDLKYHFDCIINAGLYFSDGDYLKARHIQNIIWQVAQNKGNKKSYRGCIWSYQ